MSSILNVRCRQSFLNCPLTGGCWRPVEHVLATAVAALHYGSPAPATVLLPPPPWSPRAGVLVVLRDPVTGLFGPLLLCKGVGRRVFEALALDRGIDSNQTELKGVVAAATPITR